MFEELEFCTWALLCVITSALMTLSTVVKIKDLFHENKSDKHLKFLKFFLKFFMKQLNCGSLQSFYFTLFTWKKVMPVCQI